MARYFAPTARPRRRRFCSSALTSQCACATRALPISPRPQHGRAAPSRAAIARPSGSASASSQRPAHRRPWPSPPPQQQQWQLRQPRRRLCRHRRARASAAPAVLGPRLPPNRVRHSRAAPRRWRRRESRRFFSRCSAARLRCNSCFSSKHPIGSSNSPPRRSRTRWRGSTRCAAPWPSGRPRRRWSRCPPSRRATSGKSITAWCVCVCVLRGCVCACVCYLLCALLEC